MLKTVFILVPALFAFNSHAQQRQLHARVDAGQESVSGLNVVNLVTESITSTADDGTFSIMASAGDLLVITAVHLEVYRHLVEASDFNATVHIEMIPKVTTLDEAIVNKYSHINAESLGIIPKGQRKYTPAERRLQTAGDFKPIHLINILGGSLPVDPIINAITGRTAMLKKELEVETKERLLAHMEVMNQEYFTETLGIPADYVDAFRYYAVEDQILREAVKANNRTAAEFRLAELATNYKNILTSEN